MLELLELLEVELLLELSLEVVVLSEESFESVVLSVASSESFSFDAILSSSELTLLSSVETSSFDEFNLAFKDLISSSLEEILFYKEVISLSKDATLLVEVESELSTFEM